MEDGGRPDFAIDRAAIRVEDSAGPLYQDPAVDRYCRLGVHLDMYYRCSHQTAMRNGQLWIQCYECQGIPLLFQIRLHLKWPVDDFVWSDLTLESLTFSPL
jgi:hypothetical protein